MNLPVKIITSKTTLDASCDQLHLTTIVGEICVLRNHINFITTLLPGKIAMRDTEGNSIGNYTSMREGLCYVDDGRCFIVVDQITPI